MTRTILQKILFGWIGILTGSAVFAASAVTSVKSEVPLSSTSPVVLALKVVDFMKSDVNPVFNREKLSKLIGEINSIYSICNIEFQVEEYSAVKPESFGLPFHLSSVDRMFEVRKPFDDPRYLVVINTGAWDHKKMGAPNAWTAMPGESPSGAVLESSVSTFAGIWAHEIGHYLSLNHMKNVSNLMNPIIYAHSNELTPSQCSSMRSTAFQFRKSAIRQYDGGKPIANLSAAYSG